MSNYNIITVKDKDLHIVNAKDFNALVSLAASLKPKQAGTIALGYYRALVEHMEEQKASELYDSYKCLTNDIMGLYILLSSIELEIMENNGVNTEQIDLYAAKQKQYKEVTKHNNTVYRKKARRAKSM